MERRTLSIKKRVDPATRPKVDPEKVALSNALGMRFIDRGGRYLFQKLVVTYSEDSQQGFGAQREISRTWMDIPLVPEAYFS